MLFRSAQIINVQVVADLDVGVVEVERAMVANALVEKETYVQPQGMAVQVRTLAGISPRKALAL